VGLLGPATQTAFRAAFAELFGTRLRYTGSWLGFQLGAAFFGGHSPVVAAVLAVACVAR